jgi:acetate kinase
VTHAILCLNGGSSSVKFALYRVGDGEETLLARGAVERLGLADGRVWARDAGNGVLADHRGDFRDHRSAVQEIFRALDEHHLPAPAAVGHRLVHGGPEYSSPRAVDAALLAALRRLIPFAPLHLPSEIGIIQAVSERFPGLAQVACFDTAFHRGMPELAQRLALPRALWDEGLRRYGFHGLSYEYVVATLGPAARGRTIIAHLGNGASLAAVRDGRPLDTTMGLTPTGGVIMGTRSGDLDPGVLLHLMREKAYGADRLQRLVDQEAGLLGVSGLSSDMQTLLAERTRDPRAAQAVEMFCYAVRKAIGALAAALGGLDTLVFTGGIGERAAAVRWEICQGLEYLGIRLEPRPNAADAEIVSASGSRCAVRVIPTNEDLMIARHTRAVAFPDRAPSSRTLFPPPQ